MVQRVTLGILGFLLVIPMTAAAQDYTTFRPRKVLQLAQMTDTFFNEFPLSAAEACEADREPREQRAAAGRAEEKDVTCNKGVFILAEITALWSDGTSLPSDAVVAWCVAAEIWQSIRQPVLNWIYDQVARVGSERLLSAAEIREIRQRTDMQLGPTGEVIFMISTGMANVTTSWEWHPK